MTIPNVREILLVRSTHIAAELVRREPDGVWPENALAIGEQGRVMLDSIGFECAIEAPYEATRVVTGPRR